MKKLTALVISLACILSLAGCGGVDKSEYDALLAERDQLLIENEALCKERDALLAETDGKVIQATIGGSFVAKVRSVIPGYVLDGVTPMAAVVTSFQSGPFILYLGEDLISQVEEGGIYTFEVEETGIELTQHQYDAAPLFPEAAVPLYDLKISSITPAGEDAYGLDPNYLEYRLSDQ